MSPTGMENASMTRYAVVDRNINGITPGGFAMTVHPGFPDDVKAST